MADALYNKDGVGNMVLLDELTEQSICDNLRVRHKKDLIYTYIGDVLISVNPFKPIPIYTSDAVDSYRGRYMYELPPHIYALTEDTYRNLCSTHESQCVIITGESGAGKTEAAKKVMEYIAAVSGDHGEVQRVKEQLLSSNPVLEAFGNAQTLRNDNSSRFGKYLELVFDYGGDPIGGRIKNYLLEKSRVVMPGKGERSFHIFYNVLAGLSDGDKDMYCLDHEPEFFNYLRKSGTYEVPRMDDDDGMEEVDTGMREIGMCDDEISQIYRIVGAVLWTGQIEFEQKGDDVTVKDDEPLEVISKLLGTKVDQLKASMVSREFKAGLDTVRAKLDIQKAQYTRDSLAKIFYSRMFDWLVQRVNRAIDPSNMDEYDAKNNMTIGVLDIYGFEIFDTNSFEQFNINYVNEKLQQVFIENTLKTEQEEYHTEGIEWQEIDYFNNKIVCDLIESKPHGLFEYLNEECSLGQKTDITFLDKIVVQFGSHAHFDKPKTLQKVTSFIIKHYAGDVEYSVDGFMDKNKDLVWKDLLVVGEQSDLPIVQEMFPPGASGGKKKRPETQATQFRRQVHSLMDALSACIPHYIRCIKPNDSKKAGMYEDHRVLHQIQYLGLLENVRVRRAGFAFRMEYPRFLRRYKMLSEETWPHWQDNDQTGCEHILTKVMSYELGTQFQLGKTKVFIREPVSLFGLEELRERRLHDLATLIQKAYKRYRAKKFFLELRAKALEIYHGKKTRRRASVTRRFAGDYLSIGNDVKVVNCMKKQNDSTKVLFAESALKINRKYKTQERWLMLTQEGIYNLIPGKTKLKRMIPIKLIGGVSLSTKADNYFVLHVPSEYDYLYICPRKTEFLTALGDRYKVIKDKPLAMNFGDEISYKIKKGTQHSLKFVEQPATSGDQSHAVNPNNKTQLIISVNIPEDQLASDKMIEDLKPKRMKKMDKKEKLRKLKPYLKDKKLPTYGSYEAKTGSENAIMAVATHDYDGQSNEELSFREGDKIKILTQDDDGWWQGELNGKLGYVPNTYVEKV